MAKPPREPDDEHLLPSLLDRLLAGAGDTGGYTLDEMFGSVRRDLEDLLNTHAPPEEPAEDCVLLRRSVATYGLPDLASLIVTSEREGLAVSQILEDIIVRFEPRLRDVRVAPVVDADAAKQFRMRFQIEARLAVDPFPQLAFETVLELSTGRATLTTDT